MLITYLLLFESESSEMWETIEPENAELLGAFRCRQGAIKSGNASQLAQLSILAVNPLIGSRPESCMAAGYVYLHTVAQLHPSQASVFLIFIVFETVDLSAAIVPNTMENVQFVLFFCFCFLSEPTRRWYEILSSYTTKNPLSRQDPDCANAPTFLSPTRLCRNYGGRTSSLCLILMLHNSCNKGTLSFGKALTENNQAGNARRNKKWSTQKWALFWPLIFQSTYAATSTWLVCVRQVTQAKSMHMVCARCGVRDSGDVSIIPSSNIGILLFFLFSCLFYPFFCTSLRNSNPCFDLNMKFFLRYLQIPYSYVNVSSLLWLVHVSIY